MDPIQQIEEAWRASSHAMQVQDFPNAVKLYRETIVLLHDFESHLAPSCPSEMIQDVRLNLANAYCDLAVCLGKICGPKINDCVHAILRALRYGYTESLLPNNLLYCMNVANSFMSATKMRISDTPRNRELSENHNAGYYHLKTPFPPGTPGRNWEDAKRYYERAIEIMPDSATSYHGLGLALEGLKQDLPAIRAWIQVAQLDPNYNFEVRVIYELSR